MNPKNIAASDRQRLMNHAQLTGEAFNLILVRYGHERLFYRPSVSPHKEELILKGVSLFYVWTDQLDFPQPRLRAYVKETVVAVKLEAMVELGFTNSRMKDFYDLQRFDEHFDFDGRSLVNAITSTFQRRQTSIPNETPTAFTSKFFQNDDKNKQWNAFARQLQSQQSLEEVVSAIADFVVPCHAALRSGIEFKSIWRGGKWIRETRET